MVKKSSLWRFRWKSKLGTAALCCFCFIVGYNWRVIDDVLRSNTSRLSLRPSGARAGLQPGQPSIASDNATAEEISRSLPNGGPLWQATSMSKIAATELGNRHLSGAVSETALGTRKVSSRELFVQKLNLPIQVPASGKATASSATTTMTKSATLLARDLSALKSEPAVAASLAGADAAATAAAQNSSGAFGHRLQLPLLLFIQEMVDRHYFGEHDRHNPFKGMRCPYKDCEVTRNVSLFDESTLIFMPALWSGDCCTAQANGSVVCRSRASTTLLPKPRRDQAYVFYNRESTSRTAPSFQCFSTLDSFVNYTWTYKLDSSVPFPYGGFRLLKAGSKEVARSGYAEQKTLDVLWYVGHCGGSQAVKFRWQYAQNLSQHISVDIFGRCSKRSDGCLPGNQSCVRQVWERYRFYLAFENSACKDYVTEKLFNALMYGALPIVRGLPKADYIRLAPPHSFIHTDDFPTVADLADYLRYLANNATAYNEYHAWRSQYEIYGPDRNFCKLCELATTLPQTHMRISSWWNASNECTEW